MTETDTIQGGVALPVCQSPAGDREMTLEAVRRTEETVKAFYEWLYPDGDWPEMAGLPSHLAGPVKVEVVTIGPEACSVLASVRASGSDIARVLELLGMDEPVNRALSGSCEERESRPCIRVDELGDIAVGMAERGRNAELARAMELLESFSEMAGDSSVLDRVRRIVGSGTRSGT
ncbi:MAG: hypothetical protein LBT40_13860 [Deltaproteobacteria bacterium]|nr:hypothetical protein [Deltaproteobacteria bacterium]